MGTVAGGVLPKQGDKIVKTNINIAAIRAKYSASGYDYYLDIIAKNSLLEDNDIFILKDSVIDYANNEALTSALSIAMNNYKSYRNVSPQNESTILSASYKCFKCFIDNDFYLTPLNYITADAPKVYKYSLHTSGYETITLTGATTPSISGAAGFHLCDPIKFNGNLYSIIYDSTYFYCYKFTLDGTIEQIAKEAHGCAPYFSYSFMNGTCVFGNKLYADFTLANSSNVPTKFTITLNSNENFAIHKHDSNYTSEAISDTSYFGTFGSYGNGHWYKQNGELYKVVFTNNNQLIDFYRIGNRDDDSLYVETNPYAYIYLPQFSPNADPSYCLFFTDNMISVPTTGSTNIRLYCVKKY